MTNAPFPADDLRALWQSMPSAPVAITADEMRARAARFERKVRRRNLIEYAAGVFVSVVLGWYATFPEPATVLWPVANVMIIAGVLFVMWNLHRIARAAATPAHAGAAGLIAFQREQLARQRDTLKSVWLWYIAPVVPGLMLWMTAMAVGMPGADPVRVALVLGAASVIVGFVFGGIILLNLLGAAHLQRQIDELDRYKEKA
jgi:hypothetical protein